MVRGDLLIGIKDPKGPKLPSKDQTSNGALNHIGPIQTVHAIGSDDPYLPFLHLISLFTHRSSIPPKRGEMRSGIEDCPSFFPLTYLSEARSPSMASNKREMRFQRILEHSL